MGNFNVSGTTSSYLFSARDKNKTKSNIWKSMHYLWFIAKHSNVTPLFFGPLQIPKHKAHWKAYVVGCKGCALINSKNIHGRNNKWLFERRTRNHLVLLCATQHAATHLVKRERKRAGAGGSGTPNSSTVQRPLRPVCKRSTGRVTNSSGVESGGEGAARLEWRQRSVVLEQWSPVIFLSGKKRWETERERERKWKSPRHQTP